MSSFHEKDLASSITFNSSVLNYRTSSQSSNAFINLYGNSSGTGSRSGSGTNSKYISGTLGSSTRINIKQKSAVKLPIFSAVHLNNDLEQDLKEEKINFMEQVPSLPSDSSSQSSKSSTDTYIHQNKNVINQQNQYQDYQSQRSTYRDQLASSAQRLNLQFKNKSTPQKDIYIENLNNNKGENNLDQKESVQDLFFGRDSDLRMNPNMKSISDDSHIMIKKRAIRRKTMTLRMLEEEEQKEKLEQLKNRRIKTTKRMVDILRANSKTGNSNHQGQSSPQRRGSLHTGNFHHTKTDENQWQTLNSSFVGEHQGIPLRIHGKFKYLAEIIKVKQRLKTKHAITFIFDVVVHCVINPPGLNYKFGVRQLGFDVVYTWDMICACIALLRLHIFFELIPLFSVYTQSQSKRICNQTGAKAKTKFSWKAMMKTSPYLFLALAITLSVISFGITLRNLERAKLDRNGKFDYIWDSFWVILIIMLTIGYGDIVIDTNMGRLLGIFSAFWGFLIYSLFVVSMNNLTKFDESDLNAFREYKKREGIKKLKRSAGKTIANFILFEHYHKKKMNLINYTKTDHFKKQYFSIQADTKKQIQNINSTKYMFNMMFQMRIFHQKRMVHMHKDEDTDKLLQSMEFYLLMSQNEQAFILSKFEDVEQVVSLQYSMLSEFGPSHQIEDFQQINGGALMSLEEMNAFVISRIETFRSSKDTEKINIMINKTHQLSNQSHSQTSLSEIRSNTSCSNSNGKNTPTGNQSFEKRSKTQNLSSMDFNSVSSNSRLLSTNQNNDGMRRFSQGIVGGTFRQTIAMHNSRTNNSISEVSEEATSEQEEEDRQKRQSRRFQSFQDSTSQGNQNSEDSEEEDNFGSNSQESSNEHSQNSSNSSQEEKSQNQSETQNNSSKSQFELQEDQNSERIQNFDDSSYQSESNSGNSQENRIQNQVSNISQIVDSDSEQQTKNIAKKRDSFHSFESQYASSLESNLEKEKRDLKNLAYSRFKSVDSSKMNAVQIISMESQINPKNQTNSSLLNHKDAQKLDQETLGTINQPKR
eukprot:403331967